MPSGPSCHPQGGPSPCAGRAGWCGIRGVKLPSQQGGAPGLGLAAAGDSPGTPGTLETRTVSASLPAWPRGQAHLYPSPQPAPPQSFSLTSSATQLRHNKPAGMERLLRVRALVGEQNQNLQDELLAGGQKSEHPHGDKEGKVGTINADMCWEVPPGGVVAWECEGRVGPRAGPPGPGFGCQWPGGG